MVACPRGTRASRITAAACFRPAIADCRSDLSGGHGNFLRPGAVTVLKSATMRYPHCCRHSPGEGAAVTDVYISYAKADAEWARALAASLAEYGVDSFSGECLLPGDILVHKAGDAMRQAGAGIALISPAVLESSWAKEEYAALAGESTAG